MREKNRLVGRYLCLDYRKAKAPKLGISASTKYGSAPERSRFKRLVREAFRKSFPHLPPYEINVVPRQCAKKASAAQIFDELNGLLR